MVGGAGGGGGGTGGGGPGHCCSYSIPNLAPTVSFVFVTRLVFFCYCCTFTCAGAEKVRSFRALSIGTTIYQNNRNTGITTEIPE